VPRSKDKPTPHEIKILTLLIAGQSTKQIANELHAEATNIRRSIRSLRRKLKASNDVQMGAIAACDGFFALHVRQETQASADQDISKPG